MKIELTAEQAEQFKKEGKITIEMPKEEVKPRLIDGYFVNFNSDVNKLLNAPYDDKKTYLYATKEQAEASIAQARLTQEMKLVNGDWMPDWTNGVTDKFVIYFICDKPKVYILNTSKRFLAFKHRSIAEKFLSDHYDLIMAYKPLA